MGTVEQVSKEASEVCRRLEASIELLFVQKTASELRRRLWAAQPSLVKFAAFWHTIFAASSEYGHYGLTIAAMFLVAGVHGMPHIKSKDPSYPSDPVEFMKKFNELHGSKDWKAKVNMVLALLPNNYGLDIAGKMYNEAIAVARNPTLAGDAVAKLWMTLWNGDGKHIKPESYDSAIRYLKNGIKNTLITELKRRKKDVYIDDPEKGPEMIAPSDPMQHKYHAIVEREIKNPHVRAELAKIHPDAPRFVELVLEGHSNDKEIIGDPKKGIPSMLPTYNKTYENWKAFIMPKIQKVLMEHFEESEGHEKAA
jgi:hypothetical protein